MKKVLSALALILFSLIYAQELGKEVSISKNWISVINVNNNELKLSNGRITNHSNVSLLSLSLDYYLSEVPFDRKAPSISGTLIAKNPISSLNRNSSISGVSVQNQLQNKAKDGTYYQILVLNDNKGNILDITQLNTQIAIKSGKLQTYNQTYSQEVAIKTEEKPQTINNSSRNSNDLIVDVYLTKERLSEITTNFNGIHIAKAPLNGIRQSNRLSNPSIKTNLRTIPPRGTYYLFLTLSELDSAGNPVVKNVRSFKNAISL